MRHCRKPIPYRWGVLFSLLAGCENQDPSTAFIGYVDGFRISGNPSRIRGVRGSLPTNGLLARNNFGLARYSPNSGAFVVPQRRKWSSRRFDLWSISVWV
jgi:hypothetical protein